MPGCHVELPRARVLRYLRSAGREAAPPEDPPGLVPEGLRRSASTLLNPKSEFKVGAQRGPERWARVHAIVDALKERFPDPVASRLSDAELKAHTQEREKQAMSLAQLVEERIARRAVSKHDFGIALREELEQGEKRVQLANEQRALECARPTPDPDARARREAQAVAFEDGLVVWIVAEDMKSRGWDRVSHQPPPDSETEQLIYQTRRSMGALKTSPPRRYAVPYRRLQRKASQRAREQASSGSAEAAGRASPGRRSPIGRRSPSPTLANRSVGLDELLVSQPAHCTFEANLCSRGAAHRSKYDQAEWTRQRQVSDVKKQLDATHLLAFGRGEPARHEHVMCRYVPHPPFFLTNSPPLSPALSLTRAWPCSVADARVGTPRMFLTPCRVRPRCCPDEAASVYPEEGLSKRDRSDLGKVLASMSSVRDPLRQSPLGRSVSQASAESLGPPPVSWRLLAARG